MNSRLALKNNNSGQKPASTELGTEGSAIRWYTKLFNSGVDARPMEGLAEWHLAPAFGVQVWADAERAGHSTMVINESELDDLANRLKHDGIDHAGIQNVTASRVLMVTDPDGNRIVFAGR